MAQTLTYPRRRRVHRMGGHHLMIRIVIGLVVILALASAVAIYFEQEEQFARIASRREELLRQQVIADQAFEDKLALKNQIDSDSYIEHVAREQLGMVKPGEIIFDAP